MRCGPVFCLDWPPHSARTLLLRSCFFEGGGEGGGGGAPVEGAIRCDAEGEWRAAATWLQRLREGFAPSAAVLARWRRARRLSLKEVLAEADAGAEFAWRHALEGRIAARLREAR